MILIIDNYDSFTYNVYQYVGVIRKDVEVIRNDKISVEKVEELSPQGIIISPGPGRPEDAGISVDIIRNLGSKIPIFGICLGHQAMGYAMGGSITSAPKIMHGKVSMIEHNREGVFENIPSPFSATRYHSLVISPEFFPEELEITAQTQDGVIMGVRHKKYRSMVGVQFHPESVMTESGMEMVRNFLNFCEK
ncbi:MAG: aminodeoxychorismate/anthranilate synthase component II [Leptospiraceae bacterium]|nr:aminodeoxychorismate/anthranilate synthase component II [Leptospiraceae bacterium]MCZ8239543.1 aminodeoxychorismate/anthranilate synthase component II [Leptospiraceae bacterium]MCZ8345995.1 aminodeoxychorismate/anthranilate synthase component II [Leptospiraceae bacterium]